MSLREELRLVLSVPMTEACKPKKKRKLKEGVIAGLQAIVADRHACQINGVTVDPFSAELALRVYESLNSVNQAKMATLSVKKMMTIVHQMRAT